MPDTQSSAKTPLSRLLALWLIDSAAADRLSSVRPVVSPQLKGIEAEFDEVFLADPTSDRALGDVSVRHQEAEMLARFWHGIFRGEFDAAAAERASELGRHLADQGLHGRALLAGAQRVLSRAHAAVLAAEAKDPLRAIDAVTRLVLLAADIAVDAVQARLAEKLSGSPGANAAEELQEQIHALEEMARIDGLTRLFNRRHFDKALESEIARSERHGLPLCLIMADVDHFKRINDTYGHAVGDEVLCHVAEVLQSAARRSDLIARYGGEEFAVILTSTPGDHAEIVADRIRSALEQRPVAFADGHMLRVTISAGYGVLQPDDTPKSLIERADAALYRAKEAGRNRVAG